MSPRATRATGLICSLAYGSFIVWVYVHQPNSLAQVTGGMAATIGAYRIDDASFDEGQRFFRNDQFPEARSAFERADPARQDARTQFYVAYSYYRQGWGRVYNDDELFARGLEAVDRAITVSPGGRIVVDDEDLAMKTADELKAELERGRTRE
jgi:hypothetical protein